MVVYDSEGTYIRLQCTYFHVQELLYLWTIRQEHHRKTSPPRRSGYLKSNPGAHHGNAVHCLV